MSDHRTLISKLPFYAACTLFIPLAMMLTCVSVSAKDVGKKELGTLSVQFENDLFSGSDQHYTNGIRISWLSPEGDTIKPLRTVRDFLEQIARDENKTTRFGLSLGQDMYTPEDRAATQLIVDDRPYAGWLYGGMSLHTVSDYGQGRQEQESVELNIGVVGPWSLAEETQDFVHDIRLIDTFEGWDNQLRTEPGLLVNYERKWRLFDPIKFGPTELDAIPHAGASLGNIATEANIGGAFRWGWNLPNDFGPPSLIHSVSALDRRPETSLSLYAFAGLQGRFVAHNIFLDGNTFRDSHRVDKKNWVGDANFGVAVLLGRFKISYTNAFKSREFDGQNKFSRFGSLAASFQAAF